MAEIQWFPGHMTKAGREITADLKLVDLVAELADARIPRSSRNPELKKTAGGKPTLLIVTKGDLADPAANLQWKRNLEQSGTACVFVNAQTGEGIAEVFRAAERVLHDRIEQQKQKGMVNRPLRMMIAGVPNVGKSSLINRLAGRSSAKVGDRPGVTRGKQWIRLKNGFELLDTPGVLWPKFASQEIGLNLAFTGAIRDEILDREELACELIGRLRTVAPGALERRYRVTEAGTMNYEVLEQIGKSRGFLVRGGEADLTRAAAVLLDEFRGGVLGRITLEDPQKGESE